jgi:hypothetical protein
LKVPAPGLGREGVYFIPTQAVLQLDYGCMRIADAA